MSSDEIETGEMSSNPDETQPAAPDPSQAETTTRGLGRPYIRSVDPPYVTENTSPVVGLRGDNLPGDSLRYTVFPAGIQIGRVLGGGLAVSMQLFVGPAGTYYIRVRDGNEIALQVLPAGPDLRTITPNQILAGLATPVTVGGFRLPFSAAGYSVVNSAGSPVPGVQVSLDTGTSSQVTLRISVTSTVPSGSHVLRVKDSNGSDGIPLRIAGIPALASVQPSQIPVGTTTGVQLNGSNLPNDPQSYSVVNAAGSPVPGVTFLLVPVLGASFGMIDVAASVPPATYRLQVKLGPYTSQIPLPIAKMPIVINSVQPNQVLRGDTENVTVTGSALPMASSAYSLINGSGQTVTGVLLRVTGGNSTSVVLQITVPSTTLAGTYRLRAQALGYIATAPFTVVRDPIDPDPLPDR